MSPRGIRKSYIYIKFNGNSTKTTSDSDVAGISFYFFSLSFYCFMVLAKSGILFFLNLDLLIKGQRFYLYMGV